jgi:hypothetical protein
MLLCHREDFQTFVVYPMLYKGIIQYYCYILLFYCYIVLCVYITQYIQKQPTRNTYNPKTLLIYHDIYRCNPLYEQDLSFCVYIQFDIYLFTRNVFTHELSPISRCMRSVIRSRSRNHYEKKVYTAIVN